MSRRRRANRVKGKGKGKDSTNSNTNNITATTTNNNITNGDNAKGAPQVNSKEWFEAAFGKSSGTGTDTANDATTNTDRAVTKSEVPGIPGATGSLDRAGGGGKKGSEGDGEWKMERQFGCGEEY